MSGRSIAGYEKGVLSCLGMDLSDNVAQFCAPPLQNLLTLKLKNAPFSGLKISTLLCKILH